MSQRLFVAVGGPVLVEVLICCIWNFLRTTDGMDHGSSGSVSNQLPRVTAVRARRLARR